jgi:benzoate-CoA ligase
MKPKRSIIDYFSEHAQRAPQAAAIHYRDREISYGELDALAARWRGALKKLGVAPGDRVALVMSDCPDMVVALLGIMGAGAIAVPCSTMLKPAELVYQINDCGARCVIATPEFLETVREAREACEAFQTLVVAGDEPIPGAEHFGGLLQAAQPAPLGEFAGDTPCLILYTSGSTGTPKGAVHRHGHMPWTVESVARKVYDLKPQDRLFSVPRLFFAYGIGNSFSIPFGMGASTILCRERPTPALITAIFKQYRPTVFFGVPTIFRMLLEHARQGHALNADSIKFSVSAGEVLPLSTWNEWKEAAGSEIIECIGTTELLHAFVANYRDRNRPGSSGVALEGYEVKLTDEAGRVVEGAGRGNLHVKGGTAIPYYLNKPEKTAELIRDGWVRTGDVYRRDEEGFYWFEGRGDDLFKCSGLWVSPGEVEDAVATHPAVLEAAVIAAQDEKGGTIPAAYVTLRQGFAAGDALAGQILEHAGRSLPKFKRPQKIVFMDTLPRTATGKVQRFKLRELAKGGR